MTASHAAAPGPDETSDTDRLALIRAEIQFELGLLHQRVNALLAAEAFLTIAYTAAMSNSTAWGRPFAAVAAPALSILGLLLGLLLLPGSTATARIVLTQTALLEQSVARLPGSGHGGYYGLAGRPSALTEQRRSLWFFQAVPILFSAVWIVLFVLTLVLLT